MPSVNLVVNGEDCATTWRTHSDILLHLSWHSSSSTAPGHLVHEFQSLGTTDAGAGLKTSVARSCRVAGRDGNHQTTAHRHPRSPAHTRPVACHVQSTTTSVTAMPSNGWGGNSSDAHLVVVRIWSPPARPLRRATTAGESRRQWAGAKRHRARTVAAMAHFLLFGSCLTASPVSSTQMRKLSWSQLLSDILSSGHHQTR